MQWSERKLLWTLLSVLLAAGCTSTHRGDLKTVTFSVLEDYDKGADLNEVARDFDVMEELGVDTWRGSFGWDDYEPEAGQYDFKWLDDFAALAERRGIRLRPYIAYTPEWAARGGADDQAWNDPPASIDRWREFVAQLVTALRTHANVVSYEIYNEEDTKLWWEGDVGDYIAVLNAAAMAIRKSNPHAAIIMGGLVWPDAAWLAEVCESDAASFDVAAIHAYPETWTEKGVTVENYLGKNYDEFVDELESGCGGKPVSINETGFATTPAKSERDQANWWARAIATFAAAPDVTHIGIYEIKDLPSDQPVIGDAPNHYLGILRSDRTPKLAFYTLRTLVPLMSRQEIAPNTDAVCVAGSGVRHQGFERADGSSILFVWREASVDQATANVTLQKSAGSAIEHFLDGTSAQLPMRDRTHFVIPLGADVRIFEFAH